jgi:hypothetical protein
MAARAGLGVVALAASASVGFGAALAIHLGVAYTDFEHVAPIYVGILVTAVALALARPFLLANPPPAKDRAGSWPR